MVQGWGNKQFYGFFAFFPSGSVIGGLVKQVDYYIVKRLPEVFLETNIDNDE